MLSMLSIYAHRYDAILYCMGTIDMGIVDMGTIIWGPSIYVDINITIYVDIFNSV